MIHPVIFIGLQDKILLAPDEVIRIACKTWNVDFEQLKNKTRVRSIVEKRQALMYLLCTYTTLKLKEVGEPFSGKDHSAVIHSRNAASDDDGVREVIELRKLAEQEVIKNHLTIKHLKNLSGE